MEIGKYTFEPGKDVLVRDSLGEQWYRQQFVGIVFHGTGRCANMTLAVTRVAGYSGTLRHLFCIPLNAQTAHLEGTTISESTLAPATRSPQAYWTGTLEQQLFDDRDILFRDSPVAEILYALAINVGMYEQAKRGNMTPEESNPYLVAMHTRLGQHAEKAHKMLMDIRFSDIPSLKITDAESMETLRLGEHIAADAYHGRNIDPDDVRLAKAASELMQMRTENALLFETIKILVGIIQSFGR